jgi:hypothetical protein
VARTAARLRAAAGEARERAEPGGVELEDGLAEGRGLTLDDAIEGEVASSR